MPSADQVPVRTEERRVGKEKRVVRIAGSTGSALRAVRPPQPFTSRQILGAISLRPERDRIIISLAARHHVWTAPSWHVWTAPSWQGLFSRRRLGRCSHVFGLFVRFT